MRRVSGPGEVKAEGDFCWMDEHEGYGIPEEIDNELYIWMPNEYGARSLPVTRNRDGAIGWRWDGNRDRPTLWPSIRPMTVDGQEVWHGYIDAGELQEV